MPKPNRPIILWRAKLLTLIGRPPRAGLAAILCACLLLLVAGIFLGLTAFNLNRQPGGTSPIASSIPQPANSIAAADRNLDKKDSANATVVVPAAPSKTFSETAEAVRPTSSKPVDVTKQMRRWKIPGPIILDFGWQEHPLYKDWRFHTGIDYQMEEGSAVLSLTDGEVKAVRRDDKLGLMIEIAAGEYSLLYAGLGSANVREGTRVSAGAKLGLSGSGPTEPYGHLHLGIRKSGGTINPQTLLQ